MSCRYPYCMQLYGGCGMGCTEALAQRGRRKAMGHHIDKNGQFKSDKYPDLPPDKIVVSFKHPEAWPALAALAEGYRRKDPELADDIEARLRSARGL